MLRLITSSLFVAIALVSLTSFTPGVFAQSPSPLITPTVVVVSVTSAANNVETRQIKGEIQRIQNNLVTIKADDGSTIDVTIPENVLVKRNTFDSKISELQTGDSLSITQSQSGNILSVDAISGGATDTAKSLIPITLAGLVIAGFIWWLINKTNKSHIKTYDE